MAGLFVAGCGLAVGLGDYQVEVDAGGGGVMVVPMGGAPPDCKSVADCPVTELYCRESVCQQGVCLLTTQAEGTPCFDAGGDACDGQGACVKSDGKPCSSLVECISGMCIDDVCCATQCDQVCEACDLPASEGTCAPLAAATADDECLGAVCDGGGSCVTGFPKWGMSIVDDQDQPVLDLTVDANGNVYFVGSVDGTVSFGGTEFISDGIDAYVVKLDPNGAHLYSKVFVLPGTQRATAISVDVNGNMWVVGDFVNNAVDFGSGSIVNGGNNSIFAIKLDPSGALLTAVDFFESNHFQRANDVVTDADGNVWIVGGMSGTVNFGGGNHISGSTARTEVFVVKLNGFGTWQASQVWGNGLSDVTAVRVATTPTGVALAGELRGTVDFGGGPLVGTGSGTNADVFVVLLDQSAAHLWSKSFGGGTGYKDVHALAVDAAGNIAVGGRFETSIDFGGGPLSSVGGNEDMFLAKLDAAGAHVFSRRYGDAADDGTVKGLGFDANGNLIAGADYEGTVDFGDGPHDNPTQADDIAVFKLSSDGTFLWAHTYGDSASQMVSGLAVHQASGNIAIAGHLFGVIDLGNQTLVANGSDPYVICIAP